MRLTFLLLFHMEIIQYVIHPQNKYNRSIARCGVHLEVVVLNRFAWYMIKPRNNAVMKREEIHENDTRT